MVTGPSHRGGALLIPGGVPRGSETFSRGPPLWIWVCRGSGPKFGQGFLPRRRGRGGGWGVPSAVACRAKFLKDKGLWMMGYKSKCAPVSTPTTGVLRSCARMGGESPPDKNKCNTLAPNYGPLWSRFCPYSGPPGPISRVGV